MAFCAKSMASCSVTPLPWKNGMLPQMIPVPIGMSSMGSNSKRTAKKMKRIPTRIMMRLPILQLRKPVSSQKLLKPSFRRWLVVISFTSAWATLAFLTFLPSKAVTRWSRFSICCPSSAVFADSATTASAISANWALLCSAVISLTCSVFARSATLVANIGLLTTSMFSSIKSTNEPMMTAGFL